MRLSSHEDGFSYIEIGLLVIIIGSISLVGLYVYHAKQNTDKVLSSTATHSTVKKMTSLPASSSATVAKQPAVNTTNLQASLNAITSSVSQNTSDINNASNAVSDQSGFTSVPQ